MSQSTPQPANPLHYVPKKRKPWSPILANIHSNAVLDDDAAKLLSNVQHTLAAKAPETLNLSDQLPTKLSSLSLDAAHTEKRERSTVIHGFRKPTVAYPHHHSLQKGVSSRFLAFSTSKLGQLRCSE
ncbi:unnamed protein product [Haemonchus placei]|uniref:Uncharacterized protein n=1 Tax=Haemonchus placei TaxID=6290 RepID=A0A0N4W182_HAEPC|nr:unnamed protein product [Haemonchus placei]